MIDVQSISLVEKQNNFLDPYGRFMYAIRSPQTKKRYPQRFIAFLDYVEITGVDIHTRINNFYERGKDDHQWIQDSMMSFIEFQKKRVETGKIVASTISNYYKPVRLFCDMNNILINWKLITRGIPKGNHASNDRAPTIEEIRLLIQYPDIRIKPIVTFMISSGARIGAWDYLKWKHITPIYDSDDKILAKVIVYQGDPEMYLSFITPECYKILSEWMDYRASYGEKISGDSWVMRDMWRTTNLLPGSRCGSAKYPVRLRNEAIRTILCRALVHQNIRTGLNQNKKRHEFKAAHGFRKYFRTQCENVLKPGNMSLLMGYDLGVTSSYYKPTEKELLE